MIPDPVPLRRRIAGQMLRYHRQNAGYPLDDAARVLECDRSKISRMETGQRGIRPREMRELLGEYGVTGSRQQALAALAGARKGWWNDYCGVLPGDVLHQVTVEPLAQEILLYAPQMVPELRTPEEVMDEDTNEQAAA